MLVPSTATSGNGIHDPSMEVGRGRLDRMAMHETGTRNYATTLTRDFHVDPTPTYVASTETVVVGNGDGEDWTVMVKSASPVSRTGRMLHAGQD